MAKSSDVNAILTASDDVKGLEEPRIWTPPLRELTPETSLGFDAIEFAEKVLETELYPWQKWLLIHALEIEGDLDTGWRFRFRVVNVLVSRQNGKTTLGEVLALFFLLVLGLDVLGAAHSLQLASEVWERCVKVLDEDEDLRWRIDKVRRANGKEELVLNNGARYRVVSVSASSTDAARGQHANLIMLDELRTHKSWDAYTAIYNTMMARGNGMLWCMSNAGDASSIVLRHLRLSAHKALGDPDGEWRRYAESLGPAMDDDGEEVEIPDETLGIFEWSAPPECGKWDIEAWKQANPALGYGGLTLRNLRAAASQPDETKFRTENLCQWVVARIEPPFPVGAWDAGTDKDSSIAPDSRLSFGLDISGDRTMGYIAVCGRRADRNFHVEVVEARKGIGWIVEWFRQRALKPEYLGMTVALQGNGAPASILTETLMTIDGLEVVEVVGKDLGGYCGLFYDAVCACDPKTESDSTPVYHRPGAAKDIAASAAKTKKLGDQWTFDRWSSQVDVSPLMACSMAFGLAKTSENRKVKRSVYEDYDVAFI